MNNRFQIKILKNQFYRGNLVKKQNHFYFLAKKKIKCKIILNN